MKNLSICIVSQRTRDLLRDCLRSIHETAGSLSFEIIIVENRSTDDALDPFMQYALHIRSGRLSQNMGFAIANNIGGRLARGKWLFQVSI